MFKLLIIVAFATFAESHDVIIGPNLEGKKIYDEIHHVSEWAAHQNTETVPINATAGEVISKIIVTDLRPDKGGYATIVEGGQGQKSVTLQLQKPSFLKELNFHVEVYSAPEDALITTISTPIKKVPEIFHPFRTIREDDKNDEANIHSTSPDTKVNKESEPDQTKANKIPIITLDLSGNAQENKTQVGLRHTRETVKEHEKISNDTKVTTAPSKQMKFTESPDEASTKINTESVSSTLSPPKRDARDTEPNQNADDFKTDIKNENSQNDAGTQATTKNKNPTVPQDFSTKTNDEANLHSNYSDKKISKESEPVQANADKIPILMLDLSGKPLETIGHRHTRQTVKEHDEKSNDTKVIVEPSKRIELTEKPDEASTKINTESVFSTLPPPKRDARDTEPKGKADGSKTDVTNGNSQNDAVEPPTQTTQTNKTPSTPQTFSTKTNDEANLHFLSPDTKIYNESKPDQSNADKIPLTKLDLSEKTIETIGHRHTRETVKEHGEKSNDTKITTTPTKRMESTENPNEASTKNNTDFVFSTLSPPKRDARDTEPKDMADESKTDVKNGNIQDEAVVPPTHAEKTNKTPKTLQDFHKQINLSKAVNNPEHFNNGVAMPVSLAKDPSPSDPKNTSVKETAADTQEKPKAATTKTNEDKKFNLLHLSSEDSEVKVSPPILDDKKQNDETNTATHKNFAPIPYAALKTLF